MVPWSLLQRQHVEKLAGVATKGEAKEVCPVFYIRLVVLIHCGKIPYVAHPVFFKCPPQFLPGVCYLKGFYSPPRVVLFFAVLRTKYLMCQGGYESVLFFWGLSGLVMRWASCVGTRWYAVIARRWVLFAMLTRSVR